MATNKKAAGDFGADGLVRTIEEACRSVSCCGACGKKLPRSARKSKATLYISDTGEVIATRTCRSCVRIAIRDPDRFTARMDAAVAAFSPMHAPVAGCA